MITIAVVIMLGTAIMIVKGIEDIDVDRALVQRINLETDLNLVLLLKVNVQVVLIWLLLLLLCCLVLLLQAMLGYMSHGATQRHDHCRFYGQRGINALVCWILFAFNRKLLPFGRLTNISLAPAVMDLFLIYIVMLLCKSYLVERHKLPLKEEFNTFSCVAQVLRAAHIDAQFHLYYWCLNYTGQLPGIPQPLPGAIQSMFSLATPQFGSMSLMPAQIMTQQATRHARRVYVGGLPPMANEQTIATFFSRVMSAIGGNTVGPGDAVVNVYINHEKKFAFVEMRSVEEASNAMALDGIIFEGVSVRVRRPTDYNPSLAAALGSSQPSPHLNLDAVGLTPGAIGGAEGPDRIFVGGLPYYFTDAQIRELLESFGPLRGFDLVKDRDTGNSKGYGFCVYQDPAVTDVACAALNGLKMGDKTLTVRRASASTGQVKPEQELILQQAQQHIALQKMVLQAAGVPSLPGVGLVPSDPMTSPSPTKVVCLTEVVSANELREDEEYEEILEDMREESGKFGPLVNVVIPRPSPTGEEIPGVGKVFLEYADTSGAARAKAALHGRKFGGNVVTAVYYPEDKFSMGDYGEAVI